MSEDLNAIERQRWGGPSPWAGKDSRTDAQKMDDQLPPIDARVEKHVSPSGHDYGYQLHITRDHHTHTIRELSKEDIRRLAAELTQAQSQIEDYGDLL